MTIAEAVAICALAVSVFNLYLYYRFYNKANKPAISHYIENLPPYNREDENSKIRVKNDGTAEASIESIYINFSWDKDLQLILYDKYDNPDEIWALAPNEQKVFYKRLPTPPLDKRVYIEITTEYDKKYDKTDKIEMFVPKSVFL